MRVPITAKILLEDLEYRCSEAARLSLDPIFWQSTAISYLPGNRIAIYFLKENTISYFSTYDEEFSEFHN